MSKLPLFLLILVSSNLFAQVNKDSLWSLFNDHTVHDTVKLNAIHHLAWSGYLFSQPDSAFYYAKIEYDFAKELKNTAFMAKALNTQGGSYYLRGDYNRAIDIYEQCLVISTETQDREGIASSYGNLGVVYKAQGAYAKSIEYYLLVLEMMEEIDHKRGIANSLNNIGNIYHTLNDLAKSLEYHKRSLLIMEELNYKRGVANSLSNLGNIYFKQTAYDLALDHYARSLSIRKGIDDKLGVAIDLVNMGNTFSKQGNNNKALEYVMESLKTYKELGRKEGVVSCLQSIGSIHYDEGRYNKAISYSIQALDHAKSTNSVSNMKAASYTLYQAYKSTGKLSEALAMYELSIRMRDSIISEDNQREVIRQEYKHEYRKQAVVDSLDYAHDIEIKETKLKQDRILFLIVIIVLILIIGLVAVLLNRVRLIRKQKKRIRSTLNKLKLTQSELVQSAKLASMGPLVAGVAHELNNPINFIALGTVLLERHTTKILEILTEYLKSEELSSDKSTVKNVKQLISQLNSENLQDDIEMTIADIRTGVKRISDVVEGLRAFAGVDTIEMIPTDIEAGLDDTLKILRTTIEEKAELKLNYDESIKEIWAYPGLLNQVFMNIILNAVQSIPDKGMITITTKDQEDSMKVSITDTGVGMSDEVISNVFDPFYTTKTIGSGKGLGMSFAYGIIERHNGRIEIKSKVGEGTTVDIYLPYQSQKMQDVN